MNYIKDRRRKKINKKQMKHRQINTERQKKREPVKLILRQENLIAIEIYSKVNVVVLLHLQQQLVKFFY